MNLARRDMLAGAAGLGLAALLAGGRGTAAEATAPARKPLRESAVFVPGYMPNAASIRGRPVAQDRVMARAIRDPKLPYRMLSRIGMDGTIAQALLPAFAHDVEISPDGKLGVLCGFEARDQVAFDPKTLDLVAVAPAFAPGWRGGGHAVYIDSGKTVVLSERAPRAPLRGKLESHHGRVTIRDATTLKIRGSYSTYGIDPHDIRLIEDGRVLVIANYGSLPKAGQRGLSVPREVREASVTLIDMADGRLLEKHVTDARETELRHLAAGGRERIFAIQARLGAEEAGAALAMGESVAQGLDITGEAGLAYLPAATLKLTRGEESRPMGTAADVALMQHGLSIAYDPVADQAIASFTATHHVFVFDGASGGVVEKIDTSKHGLRFPCGVTLLPDGVHYAVTGYWENLFVFERGTHRLVRDLCLYPTFFGHSHITAA